MHAYWHVLKWGWLPIFSTLFREFIRMCQYGHTFSSIFILNQDKNCNNQNISRLKFLSTAFTSTQSTALMSRTSWFTAVWWMLTKSTRGTSKRDMEKRWEIGLSENFQCHTFADFHFATRNFDPIVCSFERRQGEETYRRGVCYWVSIHLKIL